MATSHQIRYLKLDLMRCEDDPVCQQFLAKQARDTELTREVEKYLEKHKEELTDLAEDAVGDEDSEFLSCAKRAKRKLQELDEERERVDAERRIVKRYLRKQEKMKRRKQLDEMKRRFKNDMEQAQGPGKEFQTSNQVVEEQRTTFLTVPGSFKRTPSCMDVQMVSVDEVEKHQTAMEGEASAPPVTGRATSVGTTVCCQVEREDRGSLGQNGVPAQTNAGGAELDTREPRHKRLKLTTIPSSLGLPTADIRSATPVPDSVVTWDEGNQSKPASPPRAVGAESPNPELTTDQQLDQIIAMANENIGSTTPGIGGRRCSSPPVETRTGSESPGPLVIDETSTEEMETAIPGLEIVGVDEPMEVEEGEIVEEEEVGTPGGDLHSGPPGPDQKRRAEEGSVEEPTRKRHRSGGAGVKMSTPKNPYDPGRSSQREKNMFMPRTKDRGDHHLARRPDRNPPPSHSSNMRNKDHGHHHHGPPKGPSRSRRWGNLEEGNSGHRTHVGGGTIAEGGTRPRMA